MSDIFVSYAHVDNQPLDPAPNGWISTFIENLKKLLSQQLGRNDAYTLWMDHELRGNQTITSSILQELNQANILLLFISPGYCESEWCQNELKSFLQSYNPNQKRLFVVELDKIEKPGELSGLKAYPFWVIKKNNRPTLLATPVPHSQEHEYYEYLTDLALDLSEEIRQIISIDNISKENIFKESPKHFEHTVYLAQVPYSLVKERETIRRSLEQLDVRVLPESELPMLEFSNFINNNLNDAELFIQLLNEDSGQTLPQKQYEQGIAHGMPVMQWRPRDINPLALNDSIHGQLLQGSEVIASSITDFQNMIKENIFKDRLKNNPTTSSSELFVYIDASQEDMNLAEETSECLIKLKIAHSLPLQIEPGITSKDIRDDFENNLMNCNAVMMVFPHGPFVQLREHLMRCQRIKAKRETPIKIIGVFFEPDRDPGTLNIKLQELKIFAGSPVASLQTFLNAAEA